ncbi:endonuclease/exonuclease/phosphatase (EEP) superfamily protein YafD [Neolewinella xylanilytica]|uniref:Endonuclease/exonuclease/phosphatase (EEP) superfamily protein YafD n=1 Tax=Neolewinella xylanilytica TaxID=1514080 RepID=A0A2S6I6Q0_9BACT|nr:endonuclease/exonuclease/phosphatase family protein [Neolewinella xylanilytica]PPK87157.1 endonuclease/exonuclease/phosphatase (EEP) superfamily protein YafD [Neolewinella xylanilytica]
MQFLRKLLYYLVIGVGTVVTLLSLLSLIYDVSYWYTKVVDFPRVQYLIVGAISLLLFLLLNRRWNVPTVAFILGLLATITIQAFAVLPYLIGPKQVPDAKVGDVTPDNTASLMLANVLVTNRQADALLEIVQARDPDLLLVMENDQWWAERLAPLRERYPHTIEYPAGNGYGMSLYSKLALADERTLFFNQDSVPAFRVRVTLPDGSPFILYAMHPVAPVPSKQYPDNQGEKEVAFEKLADRLANDSLPVMVAGDFNDVTWSRTARLFQHRSQLNNVRLGRGLYNTFDATSCCMRWPLDHYFVSPGFALVELARLPAFGSDHFPMYARFTLTE